MNKEVRDAQEVTSVWWKVKLGLLVIEGGDGLTSAPTTWAPRERRRVVVASPIPEDAPGKGG